MPRPRRSLAVDGRRVQAGVGSLVFLLLAPGIVAGVIPWWLTRWEMESFPWPLRLVGIGLIAAGTAALLHSFVRFVMEGSGTPAPVAPTEELVVGGLYRYLRNPMYVAVAATIFGQALLLGQLVLLAYGAIFLAVVMAFVRWYEEPTLARTYGEQYEEYKRSVPGWLPLRRARADHQVDAASRRQPPPGSGALGDHPPPSDDD